MVEAKSGGNIDFKKLQQAIVNDEILIGYPEGIPHNKSYTDLDEIAKFNSESEEHPRPFLEDGIYFNKDKIASCMKEQYLNMFKGKVPNYNKIAVTAINGIQELVRGEYYKSIMPNSEKTIWSKTSKKGRLTGELKDKPLIDTSQTINGVTYTVMTSKGGLL